jgi:predicted DNA-binding antitoxin AbrB/MazE fold protein
MMAEMNMVKQTKEASGVYTAKRNALSQTVEAIYDGKVLRPKKPLGLEPNTSVRITVEAIAKRKKAAHFLDTIESLNLQGPPDWAENIEEYLDGEKSGHES